jgi:hypothetical protein
MRSVNSLARLDRVGAGITCALLLAFTGAGVAVAEEPPPSVSTQGWIDDPYQPHDTTGTNLRVGSAVGYLIHDGRAYTAVGGALAVGPRIGRFTLEADFLYMDLSAPGPSTLHYGHAERLGIMGRVDVLRIGPRVIGANSLLAFYAEGGAARQWHNWSRPGDRDPQREVPIDGAIATAVVGFGLNLDHRLEQPRGFPRRVGWQLGWQLTSSRTKDPDPMVVCRGASCVAAPVHMREAGRDTALLVTSTIAVTW